MRSFTRTRTIVKSVTALTIAGSSLAGLMLVQPLSGWNVSSSGLVRFGRAAVAVAYIVVDYKVTLRGIDPSSERYLLLKSQVMYGRHNPLLLLLLFSCLTSQYFQNYSRLAWYAMGELLRVIGAEILRG